MEKQLNKPFVKIVGGFRKVPKIEKKVCQRCGAPLDWQSDKYCRCCYEDLFD